MMTNIVEPVVPHRPAPDSPLGGLPSRLQDAQQGSVEDARRRLRVRLLRDLVAHGLYRIPTDALAEKLADVVLEPR